MLGSVLKGKSTPGKEAQDEPFFIIHTVCKAGHFATTSRMLALQQLMIKTVNPELF